MAERVGRLEEWTEGHEARCEERVGDIKSSVANLQKTNWVLIVAVCGWALSQLYDRATHPQAPSQSVVVAPAAPPALPR